MSNSSNSDANYWVSRLQPQIDACENCQPYEDDTIWVAGDPQTLSEFLYDKDVPENEHETIAEQLNCGQCSSDLDLDFEIVVNSVESQLDEIAGDRFGEWVVEDSPSLRLFVEYLQRCTNSGSSHPVGNEIINQMKELRVTVVTGDWWRAQSIKESEAPPTIERLGPPPHPPSSGGRFNRSGKRVFYLGSDKSSAVSEARKYQQPGEQVWVQGFRITDAQRILELAPPPHSTFRDTGMPLLFAGLLWCNGLVQQNNGDPRTSPAEYLLPQFIAESAISLGINGIKFNSLLHDGTNLVLFNWDNDIVSPIACPERIAD